MPKKSTAKTTEKKIADAMKRGDGVIAVKKGENSNYLRDCQQERFGNQRT